MRGYKSRFSKVFDECIEKMNIIEKELENTESKLSVVEKKVESIEPKLTELEEILNNGLIDEMNNDSEGKLINGDKVITDLKGIEHKAKYNMMSYREAYELMQKGYKVARQGWINEYKYIYIENSDTCVSYDSGYGLDENYHFTGDVGDYSALDWYVWKE